MSENFDGNYYQNYLENEMVRAYLNLNHERIHPVECINDITYLVHCAHCENIYVDKGENIKSRKGDCKCGSYRTYIFK
jgi:hypothetical protein